MSDAKSAADQASSIMETISPRGPGSLSNERWNQGYELITAAILRAQGAAVAPDNLIPCNCNIGQCHFLTEHCREMTK